MVCQSFESYLVFILFKTTFTRFKNGEYKVQWDDVEFSKILRDVALLLSKADYPLERIII